MSYSPETNARAVEAMMERLDAIWDAAKGGTVDPSYWELRDQLLDFAERHPEIASIVRAAGYPA